MRMRDSVSGTGRVGEDRRGQSMVAGNADAECTLLVGGLHFRPTELLGEDGSGTGDHGRGKAAGDRNRRAALEEIAERAGMLAPDEVAELGLGVAGAGDGYRRGRGRTLRICAARWCRSARQRGRRAPRHAELRGERAMRALAPGVVDGKPTPPPICRSSVPVFRATRGSPARGRPPAPRRRETSSTCRRRGRASAAGRRSRRRNDRARCAR